MAMVEVNRRKAHDHAAQHVMVAGRRGQDSGWVPCMGGGHPTILPAVVLVCQPKGILSMPQVAGWKYRARAQQVQQKMSWGVRLCRSAWHGLLLVLVKLIWVCMPAMMPLLQD